EIRFDNAFLFAYSPRHSTPAFEWPDDVPAKEKNRRLVQLIDLQREISRDINLAQVGQTVEILVEGRSAKDAARLSGRTRGNKLVNFAGDLDATPPGSLVKVETTGGFLWGFSGDKVQTVAAPHGARAVIELVAA
ncbi:MAG TPA: TRAM domain-containing protein, partial [Abditibacteriaceae bacterium]|nr:TRAM domain-containing protein [Abditibacteriaceae bacterium]